MITGLDHIAIVVPDTEAALRLWRDQFGFAVLFAERVNNDTTLLTHLDLGNTQLQLVEPLIPESPLWAWLEQNGGPGLHHLCLTVEDVTADAATLAQTGIAPGEPQPHQGTRGKRALFLDRATTAGTLVELTGP